VNRRDEPVELWSEQGASEARLKALPRPPRVLHLATHGFYRAADRPQDRPMLLAGVALALGRGRPDDPPVYGEAFRRGVAGTELVTVPAPGTWSSSRRPSPSWRRWRDWIRRALPPAIAGGAAPRLRRSGRLAALPSAPRPRTGFHWTRRPASVI